MKKMNAYYVISIISLSFMMLILLRTLQINGWFEEHREKSTAEFLIQNLDGQYLLTQGEASRRLIQVSNQTDEIDGDWISVSEDSVAFLLLKLSEFEDEQALIELFRYDSVGLKHRIEGCELLISDVSGAKTGSTLGEFCGLKGDAQVYIGLDVTFDEAGISLQVESRHFEDQSLIKREDYFLERQEIHDE